MVRPTTAQTRRAEIQLKHALPEGCFQEIFAELQQGDAEGVERDTETGALKPTSETLTLLKFNYTIRKGSISDKLFNMASLDVAPPAPKTKEKTQPTVVAPGDELDVYEVEALVGKRTKNGRTQYEVKWQGWEPSANTWEAASRLHPDLVRAYEGKPLLPPPPPPQSSSAPVLFKRGAGCARARLSKADQRRGGVPTTMSMVAGNVVIAYKVPKNRLKCPTLKIIFYILTMDANGFITWPTNYDLSTQAQPRKQARVLLKRMIDDPLNPCDETMLPALTQTGGAVRVPPPPRAPLARA